MATKHKVIIGAAQQMTELEDASVDLVVTSPPYPMIEMWDEIMAGQNPAITTALKEEPRCAYELMHAELDKVWSEVARVLKPGCFACINIGDATRTINGEFALYPNHSRIINAFISLGLTNLPNILWRKQTNAPNKFMGSGMLPAGAYVTLEHEWILIFRKGGKRVFKTEAEKQYRRESAFFWEERNTWFSDLWDLKGTRQRIEKSESRERSAAYPFEIPYRLINMYSLRGDTVLDPFLGTGTSTIAAIASERNSIGYEIDNSFDDLIEANISSNIIDNLNQYTKNRVEQHRSFINDRLQDNKGEVKHFSDFFGMPVMTNQETEMKLSFVDDIQKNGYLEFEAEYLSPASWGDNVVLPVKSRTDQMTIF